MPKTPENSQEAPKITLQAVLDAVSSRSAFTMTLRDRIDRYHLLEATRAALREGADAQLVQELHGRRTETLLALASYATTDEREYQIKTTAVGGDFDLPDGKFTDQHLLIMMVLTALTADGRRHGISVEVKSARAAQGPADLN